MIMILGQGTHMVLLEVVGTHSPVSLLTEDLALRFAAFKGKFLAEVAPDDNKVANTVKPNLLGPRRGQLATAATATAGSVPLPHLRSCLQHHTHDLPPEVQVGEAATDLLVKLPGVLERRVQQPGDSGPIPLLTADPDAQVVIILVKSVDTTHACILLPDNVMLRQINILLGRPGVAGAGGNGLCPQDVAKHGHRRVVVPSHNNLGLVLEDCHLVVASLLLLEGLHLCQGGLPSGSLCGWYQCRNSCQPPACPPTSWTKINFTQRNDRGDSFSPLGAGQPGQEGWPSSSNSSYILGLVETHHLALVEVEDDDVTRNGAQAPRLEAKPDRLVPY